MADDIRMIHRAHRWAGLLLFWGAASPLLAAVIAVYSGGTGMGATFRMQVAAPLLLAAGACLGWARCRGGHIEIPLRAGAWDMATGIVCAALMWPGAVAISALGGTDAAAQAQTAAYVRGIGLPAALLAGCVLPALCEEILARGFLYGVFSKRGPAWGVAASGIGFALLHGDPVQALYALYCGIVLGCVRMSTGSVLPGIAAHMAFNAVGILAAYFGSTGAADAGQAVPVSLVPVLLGAAAVPCTLLIRRVLAGACGRNWYPERRCSGWPAVTAWSVAGAAAAFLSALLLRW